MSDTTDHFDPPTSPGEVLLMRLETLGWNQSDLASVMDGRYKPSTTWSPTNVESVPTSRWSFRLPLVYLPTCGSNLS